MSTTDCTTQAPAINARRFRIDEAEIRQAWDIYCAGHVTELRALNAQIGGEWRRGTFSGYFDSVDAMVKACRQIEHATGVYFTPNPVKPSLLARSYNRARIIKDREPLTGDHDILERRWLLIDVDAKRPAGISSTLTEKAAARELITAIDCELWEQGYPPGIIGDSGNGYHLTIPIRLPADDKGFHERLLKGLAAQFNNTAAEVDITVHNAARIWKLPGSMVCKGDDSPEIGRRWRMSRIHQVCREDN